MNVEYKIGKEFACYGDCITVGGIGYNKLEDSEQNIFISDCLTHEFTHALLEHMFDKTTSQLYDFIGDSLLNKSILKKGACLTCSDTLWSDMFKKEGIQYLYNEYMIDNIDLIQAYIITGGK